MGQEEDPHEGGDLAQGEVFTDQPCRRRYRGIAGHAQAGGKDDGREEGLGHDEEIEGDPDGAEAVEKGQNFSFGQGIAQGTGQEGAADGRDTVDGEGPAGCFRFDSVMNEL